MHARNLRRFAAVLLALALIGAAKAYENGTFALLGGTQKIASHFWAEYGKGGSATLKVRQFQPDGTTPILKYDVDMQKTMHLVIVSEDFANFYHLHPALDVGSGTFSTPFPPPNYAKYYVFADTTPHGIGQQVFRFTYDTGSSGIAPKISTSASSPDAKAGPYTVILQTTTIAANEPQALDLTVTKGDDPAEDLVPYLGAAAHCVSIDVKTLQYVHVHPMLKGQKMGDMSQTSMERMENQGKAGPFMTLHMPPLPAGTYKTWIQIAGGPDQHVYTAAFTIVAK
ncbi:MAG: hypothetical protein JO199_13145 [Candidatus Eremiobacteraeota bacterium]|nr:hypothetical protein [Candidatus Eremiobacteraeota bacterium]